VPNVALIAGATGAAAKRLVEQLVAAGWRIIGVSRNPPASRGAMTHIVADLFDPASVRAAIAPYRDITHLFLTVRSTHGETGVESVEENLSLMRNALDAVEAAAPGLEHVHLVEGTKWYGLHLGPFRTPAREDDPRHMPPNFYDQEDLLRERQKGQRWTWSASRPNFLCDFDPGRPRNLTSLLGAYGAICKELGVPLDYPGTVASFQKLGEVTSCALLARAMMFMATSPGARNEAFNVTNGDVFRWQNAWPKLAHFFGVAPGEPRPLLLAEWMADKKPVWQRIVARHGLAGRRLEDVAVWAFGDFVFRPDYDIISSTTKLRCAGFHEMIDTEEMLLQMLAAYREARIIP
jgi:nucleoside-diphosphate-sugar epimerase